MKCNKNEVPTTIFYDDQFLTNPFIANSFKGFLLLLQSQLERNKVCK